jgi:hypothetical protein
LIPLLEEKSIGEAYFEVSKRVPEQAKDIFVRAGAYFGCVEAQFEYAKNHCFTANEIFYWYSQAAAGGNAEAADCIAVELAAGKYIKTDYEKAIFYSTLAVNNNRNQNSRIYLNHALLLDELKKTEEAEKYFRLATNNSENLEACFQYGLMLQKHDKFEMAQSMYLSAGQKGHVNSMTNYVVLCKDKKGYEPLFCARINENVTSFKEAYLLAHMYEYLSKELQVQYKEDILKILFKLSQNEDRKESGVTYFLLGSLYRSFETEAELKQAVQFFLIASERGEGKADIELGNMYRKGWGVAKDPSIAFRYHEQSIERGLSDGYNSAGLFLMDLDDPGQDPKAFRYFQKAFKEDANNRTYSAYNLAQMHKYGRGGALKNAKLIENYYRIAGENPELIVIANYGWFHYLATNGILDLPKFINLLQIGVEQKDPESLSAMGQCMLLDPQKSQDKKLRREAVLHIFNAAKAGVSSAKVIFTCLTQIGIEWAIKKDPVKAERYLQHFNDEEIRVFENALATYIVKLKEVLQPKAIIEESNEAEESPTESDGEEVAVEVDEIVEELELSPEPEAIARKPNLEILKLQAELELIQGKKQVKWRKVRSLMERVMTATTGSLTPGKGSGHRVEIGGEVSSLHIPHGNNSTELKGGRLESTVTLLQGALEKAAEAKKKENE